MLAMLVPEGTLDLLAPRETLAGLDSATLAPEELLETKASQARVALRGVEATSARREIPGGKARRVSLRILAPLESQALGAREDPQDLRESPARPETLASRSVTS